MDNAFEQIVPWNGAQDTGRDVRLKWQRNFERIKSNFEELTKQLEGISMEELKKLFLSKVAPDTDPFLLTLLAGARFFEFVQGMVGGSGAAVYRDPDTGRTYIEADGARLRDELVVPKITFNCVDVISGDKANTFAFGTVKEVDTEAGIATLDLLEGQLGTLHEGDICRGVFHNLEGGNDTEDGTEDDNGFYHYAGFSTAYFSPEEILEDAPGVMRFRYILQPGTSVHPLPGMNFFAYGNFTDKSRQSITYETRRYTRRLKDMDTWGIDPTRNISMQDGLLDGLTIGGMVMKGYGTFQENNYFTGTNIQFSPEQLEELQGKSGYSVSLSSYERVVKMDADGNITSLMRRLNVVADGENVVTDDLNVTASEPLLQTYIQAFKGEEELAFDTGTPGEGTYIVTLTPVGCTATVSGGVVTVTGITDRENCYVELRVNCEGMAVIEKVFGITVVRDGEQGDPGIKGDKGDPGDDGLTPVSYRIITEPTVVRVDKNGNLSSTSVKAYVVMTVGGESIKVESFPEETYKKGFLYAKNLAPDIFYDTASVTVPVEATDKYVSFLLSDRYKRNTYDFATVPIIRDGEPGPAGADGLGSIVMDLDNEMISVACDANGTMVSGLPTTVHFTMYYGTTPLTLNKLEVVSSPYSGTNFTRNPDGIIIYDVAPEAPEVSRITLRLTGRDAAGNTYTRDAVITVLKVMPGADGKDALIYQLVPSQGAIKKGVDISVSCSVTRNQAGTVTTVNTLPTGYRITSQLDTGAEQSYQPGSTLYVSTASQRVTFRLYDEKSLLLDLETLPVVSDGQDGDPGLQGCLLRVSRWTLLTEYRNDEALTSGTRFLDVALVPDTNMATGFRAYKCKRTHTASTSNAPGNTAYWEEFAENVGSIFTSLIIAKNAKIDLMQSNQLVVHRPDGTVTIGLTGDYGGKAYLWAGGMTPAQAKFRVDEDGNGDFAGNITATSLRLRLSDVSAPGTQAVNGAITTKPEIVLPALAGGECMEVRMMVPLMTKVLMGYVFSGANANVKVRATKTDGTELYGRTLTGSDTGGVYMLFVGVNEDNYTVWNAFPMGHIAQGLIDGMTAVS